MITQKSKNSKDFSKNICKKRKICKKFVQNGIILIDLKAFCQLEKNFKRKQISQQPLFALLF